MHVLIIQMKFIKQMRENRSKELHGKIIKQVNIPTIQNSAEGGKTDFSEE